MPLAHAKTSVCKFTPPSWQCELAALSKCSTDARKVSLDTYTVTLHKSGCVTMRPMTVGLSKLKLVSSSMVERIHLLPRQFSSMALPIHKGRTSVLTLLLTDTPFAPIILHVAQCAGSVLCKPALHMKAKWTNLPLPQASTRSRFV